MKNKLILVITIIIVIILSIFIYSNKTGKLEEKKSKNIISNKKAKDYQFDVFGSGELHCTGNAKASNVKVDIWYDVAYKDGYLTRLISHQGVTSINNSDISEYVNAYNKLKDDYKGIKYYDIKVVTTKTSTYIEQDINYSLVNYKDIIKVEGQDNQIFTPDGKVKLITWLNLGETFGTKCNLKTKI
jgi:hypothetical protein